MSEWLYILFGFLILAGVAVILRKLHALRERRRISRFVNALRHKPDRITRCLACGNSLEWASTYWTEGSPDCPACGHNNRTSRKGPSQS